MDHLDREILRALQLDARIKNAELARDLGVAPSTMLERVRRLEERGYFKGFRAIVNPEKLGWTVQAMVSVSLGQHSTKTIRPFEEAVKSIPNILTCYHVTGVIFHRFQPTGSLDRLGFRKKPKTFQFFQHPAWMLYVP